MSVFFVRLVNALVAWLAGEGKAPAEDVGWHNSPEWKRDYNAALAALDKEFDAALALPPPVLRLILGTVSVPLFRL